jgi:putative MFS transporter
LFLGAMLTGPVADRFGRRRIFATNMVMACVLSLLQFLVTSGWELLVLRVAIGFLLGTDYVVSKALLIEFVPRRLRGRLLGLLSVAWAGGYACAYAVGFALTARGPGSWRWMLLSSAVPCLLVAPLRITIPESPLWLMGQGHTSRALQIVRRKIGTGIGLPAPGGAEAAPRTRWSQLFSPRWRIRTLVACTFFACQVIPYFAVGTFVAQLMSALALRSNYIGGLIYNIALVGGAIMGLLIVDRISRRTFLVGSFTISALAMLLLGLHLNALLMIVLFAIFAGVLSAASNLVYVYLPELFPTRLRASGIGLAVAASRIGSAVGTFLLPVVVVSYGARAALGACVAVLGVGAAVCYRWAPETRNVNLVSLDSDAGE